MSKPVSHPLTEDLNPPKAHEPQTIMLRRSPVKPHHAALALPDTHFFDPPEPAVPAAGQLTIPAPKRPLEDLLRMLDDQGAPPKPRVAGLNRPGKPILHTSRPSDDKYARYELDKPITRLNDQQPLKPYKRLERRPLP